MSQRVFNCQDVDERCELALDGELESADAQSFWAHVQGCPACEQKVEMCKAIAAGLPCCDPLSPPALEARAQLACVKAFQQIQGIEKAARERLRWQRRLVLAVGWVGAACLVVWGALLFGRLPAGLPADVSLDRVRLLSVLGEKLHLPPVYLVGAIGLLVVVFLIQSRTQRLES